MRKKIILSTLALIVLAGAAYFIFGGSGSSDANALPTVKVSRATIVDKALAVGTIEPENEISVKSKVSGVVKRIFADAGSYVRAGSPLLEVRPDPTPLELAEAKRQLQMREVDMVNLDKERVRQESMVEKQLISNRDYEEFQRRYQENALQVKLARERLALLESGRVMIENTQIESIIKAPIDGFVLRKMVEVGDPVTPLTSYQEGTVLMKMANMERLVFKGTVDEIDVGKLKEGLEAELKIGALPADKIVGTLSKISLKAEKKENATVFPIEVHDPGRQQRDASCRLFRQRERDHPEEGQRPHDPGARGDLPERLRVRELRPGRGQGRGPLHQDRPERRHQHRGDVGARRGRQRPRETAEADRVGGTVSMEQIRTTLTEFVRDLRAQKLRTALTVFGIMWGTVAIVVLLAFGMGFKRQLSINMHGIGESIAIMFPASTSKPFEGFGIGRPIRLTEDDAWLMRDQIPELKAVCPEFMMYELKLRNGENIINGPVDRGLPGVRRYAEHHPGHGGEVHQRPRHRRTEAGGSYRRRGEAPSLRGR